MLLQSKLFVYNGIAKANAHANNANNAIAVELTISFHAIPFHTVNWINLIFAEIAF